MQNENHKIQEQSKLARFRCEDTIFVDTLQAQAKRVY